MTDAMQLARENFMNLPSVIISDWPFIIGFGLIEAGVALVSTMTPDPESTSGRLIKKSLEAGVSNTLKFGYWDGYTRETGK
jgi:hypothetical protein